MESKSLITNTYSTIGLDEKDATGTIRRPRTTDPDVFTNPDSARIRARQINCIGIRKYDSASGGYVWMPCSNESDYRRQMGTSHSGRLQRRQEIQNEIRRFVRGKGHEEVDQKSGAYTKPEMREKIKNRIMAGDKGGKPGQWSARKAQLLAQEYKKSGGGYKGGKTQTQRSLSRWSKEKWRTSDGKPANRGGGMRRYLPQAAWSKLTPNQIRAANRKKIQGSKRGAQYVQNTEAAMNARRSSQKQIFELALSEKALGRGVGSYAVSRAIDRPKIGRKKRGRSMLATGGVPGTKKPTGSRVSRDLDGWADEGTTNPVWVGLPNIPEDGFKQPSKLPYFPEDKPEKPTVGPYIPSPEVPELTPYRRESAARRMRQFDNAGLTGAMSATESRINFTDEKIYDLIRAMVKNGAYRDTSGGSGRGSHEKWYRDIPNPDGSMSRIMYPLNIGVKYPTLRERLLDAGFISESQVPKKNAKPKISLIPEDTRSKVRSVIKEFNIEIVDGKVKNFPGFARMAAEVRKATLSTITAEDLAIFMEQENDILWKAINATKKFYWQQEPERMDWENWRKLIQEVAQEKLPNANMNNLSWIDTVRTTTGLNDLVNNIIQYKNKPKWFNDWFKSNNENKQKENKPPSLILQKLTKEYLSKSPVERLNPKEKEIYYGWGKVHQDESNPFVELSDDTVESILIDLSSLADRRPADGSPYSDKYIFENVLGVYRDPAATDTPAELPLKFYYTIIDPDPKVSKDFFGFAKWRDDSIKQGRFIDDRADLETGQLTGSMASTRGDGNRRLVRRSNSGALVGAMAATPDDRRKDFALKKRRWQADIITRAYLDDQSWRELNKEYLENGSGTPTSPQLFPEFMERFKNAELDSITGLGKATAWAHNVIDVMFQELLREWGPNETKAYGDYKPFNYWDSPMSALDIENLEANKRTIVSEFLNETLKLDPNSPFAAWGNIDNLSSQDLDIVFKLYVVPELLKPSNIFTTEPLPFVVDPINIDTSLRNFAEYQTMKKLGIQSTVSDAEFDAAVEELFVDAPNLEFQTFISELNDAYDRFKETGLLPGDFTHEELIDPTTNRFYTKDKWRELFNEASMKFVEVNNDYTPNVTRWDAGDKYMGWFRIGVLLGYATDEDLENGQDQAEEMDEVDPFPDVHPRNFHFDPKTPTEITKIDGLGWIYRSFAKNVTNWAYDLAEKYHSYDMQQVRYTPGLKEEIADFDKYDWDKLIELIEDNSDEDLPFSGTRTPLEKKQALEAANILKSKTKYDGKTPTSKKLVDDLWAMFTVDGLTNKEISAKLDVHINVVDKVLAREKKSRGLTDLLFKNQQTMNDYNAEKREEQFQSDLVEKEISRLKQLKLTPSAYLSALTESLEEYKAINKQANSAYSRARARFAELATLGRKLLLDVPDGRDWDPKKESEAAFKNRWLREIKKREETLALIVNQIQSQQWNPQDRISASKRILDRSKKMIADLNAEIGKVEKLQKMSEVEGIRKRHQIQSLKAAREAAQKAVQGLYPQMTEEEVTTLLQNGGLTGSMAGSIRGLGRSRKAQGIIEYSSRNLWDKRGSLRRTADRTPGAKSRPKVMRVVDWLSDPKNIVSVANPKINMNRRNVGELATDSTPRINKFKIANRFMRANNEDLGQKRPKSERAEIKELQRSAKKLKINIDRYFSGQDDDEDVKWSSNDWSYAKTSPIRGADMVIYRNNPKIKNPEQAIEVLVIARKSGPFTGARALPGGLQDEGETLIQTATREMNEEVGISAEGREVVNLGIVKSRDWDPRFVEGVTVQGISIRVPYDQVAVAGSDAMKADWVTLGDLISGDSHIAFGHSSFLKETFGREAPVTSQKLALHERASRIRNRRLIEKINAKRSEAGQKLFPISSNEDIRKPFDLIRPTDPRYTFANDPNSNLAGAMASGGSSERYDIKPNDDKTFSIIDTQNNNLVIAGPFPTRNQALYAAIKKDRDPNFDPQTWVRNPKSPKKNSRKKNKTKKTRKKINEQQASVVGNEQLSFDDLIRLEKMDQKFNGDLIGRMTNSEMRTELQMGVLDPNSPPFDAANISNTTLDEYAWNNSQKGPLSNVAIPVTINRWQYVWTPYVNATNDLVPDSAKQTKPIFFIIGGHPGSLKSSIREQGLIGIPGRKDAVTIDPDEIKLILPEWDGFNPPEAAKKTHDESVALSAYSLAEAVARESANLKFMGKAKDIVHDSIGRLEKAQLLQPAVDAKKAGFGVIAYYFLTEQGESEKRVAFRRQMTGRGIQRGAWQSAQASIQETFNKLTTKSIDERSGLADLIYIYDTTDPNNIKRIAVWTTKSLNELELAYGKSFVADIADNYNLSGVRAARTSKTYIGDLWLLPQQSGYIHRFKNDILDV